MLLYALFDKFGDDVSKKRFKEVVSMTDVGRMIYEEGMRRRNRKRNRKRKIRIINKTINKEI